MINNYKLKNKKNKIFDCITFFDENLLVNARFEILNEVVDYFIICESAFDHKGNAKKINFKLLNKKFENKIRHIVINENFPNLKDCWSVESYQREKIQEGLKDASSNDLIMYSDSDEIPNPKIIKNISLKKKYAVFLQKFYVYKINVFNENETPWEGTRICKKKDLKSFTHLRKKIRSKNLKKSFFKFYIEKNIELITEGGWHFNNMYHSSIISKKLQTFQHSEFSQKKYSDEEEIKKRILNLEDLFNRNHKYEKVKIDESYPEFIRLNQKIFKEFIS
jgi:beta-1,4-mannosyl-glycoprotein beta-1,4-N-acetylglucosaminyltransferase